jgi:hypothetical protein
MFVQSLILTGVLLGIFPGSDKNPVIDDFNDRVQKYWDIHKKAESAAPESDKKKEPDPAAIIAHETATADAIRAARKNAAEGDIFTPPVQKILIRTIKQQLSSGAGAKAREMILGEGNPKSPESESASRVAVQVNAKYPSSAPLSTVPPSVLLKLPKLPQGLEYRFVGRHLILFDSKANLIVDIVRNAVR